MRRVTSRRGWSPYRTVFDGFTRPTHQCYPSVTGLRSCFRENRNKGTEVSDIHQEGMAGPGGWGMQRSAHEANTARTRNGASNADSAGLVVRGPDRWWIGPGERGQSGHEQLPPHTQRALELVREWSGGSFARLGALSDRH